jgi:hypothetical protein
MPEWWTYGLSDFLLFAPRTYYRLLQRHNSALWPAQILTLGAGFLILRLLRHPSSRQGRVISSLLGVLWAWIGWAFLWNRYASINWAATYAVPAFALEALGFVWFGGVQGRWSFRPSRNAAGFIGTSLFVLSLAIYPILAPLAGRPWQQAEIFGIAPDPTALGTLGLVLLAHEGARWPLLIVPMLWCLMSGAILFAMGSPEAWVQLPAPFIIGGVIAWSRRTELKR